MGRSPSGEARPDSRFGYGWLAAGGAVSLFAVHGRWDLPVAPWLFCVFFLRFTRTRRPLAGMSGVPGGLGLSFRTGPLSSVRPAGFEPATLGLEVLCSIH
jgi:hypothetical protein